MSQKIRKSIALMLGTAIISMPMPTYASGFLNIVITADPKLESPAVEPEISESEAPVAEPEIIEPEPPVVEPPIVELPVVSEELDLETFGQTKIQKITKNNMDMLNDEVSSISRYAFVPKRVIFEEDDILYVVDVASINKTIPVTDSETNYTHQIDNWIDHAVIIDGFNVHNLEKVSSQEIPLKLPIFAGFHAGEDFNFILSGQSQEKNMTIANGVPKESWEEDLNLEIIRVDKFSKEFNRLGSTRINSANIFTVSPFESGTTSMVTNGNNLIIHSGREMLENKDDGINHQAQLTIDIDIDTMTHTNPLKNWNQPNYVSHSFNQFAKYDGDQPILLDLGDAYPRSVVITKYGKPDAEESWRYETIDAFKIPGTIGANQTGVTVGGFEISENNYLTAINAINYDLATGFNSYEIEGLTKEERDIIILVTNKENEETQEVKLTDYEDTNTLGGTPKLVSIGNNQFMVLWNEFTGCIYKKNVFGQFEITIKGQNLKYVIIDENGTKLSEIKTFTEGKLSQYVQPIKIGNKVVWVAGENYYSIFLN
ncbi:hypothetical protein AN640_04350 [Candidatus Epulonipiscium fishelsonii]|uniref:Uncharacterized protein n=1 Tax=Candidatus Epulonipiscium fishelsonii TaxID=77094 RepID=A0ACC8XIG9_9FIRM|nr:hypothetical protein AN640_04350 [Epulopiscium sp. SCG-D08WGA-EpuloA1]